MWCQLLTWEWRPFARYSLEELEVGLELPQQRRSLDDRRPRWARELLQPAAQGVLQPQQPKLLRG